VVVIFQENVSFDHYFGTYPFATNSDGSTFTAAKGTPAVNGLNFSLLAANPNAANPKRLDSSPTGLPGSVGGLETCDQDHNYSDEQQAFDGGKMDQFVESLGSTFGNAPGTSTPCSSLKSVVMDYYDGNSVTAMWNYAELRDERQLLGDDLRAVGPGSDQPGVREHRRCGHGSRVEQPVGLDLDLAERRHHPGRQGRLLAHERRAALLGRLLDP
jgi:phospholipase C